MIHLSSAHFDLQVSPELLAVPAVSSETKNWNVN